MELRLGDLVLHRVFGEGEVVGRNADSYLIDFGSGTKSIVVGFPLKRVDSVGAGADRSPHRRAESDIDRPKRHEVARSTPSGATLGGGRPESPEQEGKTIVKALAGLRGSRWEARAAIVEMKSGGSANWRQMEWIGFYLEFKSSAYLNEHIGGGPGPRFGRTRFDYVRAHVWDLKVHPT